MDNTKRTEVFFVYCGSFFEKECKTLRGARSAARALSRRFTDAAIFRSVSEGGRSWMEPVSL